MQSNVVLFFLESQESRRERLPLCWAGTVPITTTISSWQALLGSLQPCKTRQEMFSEYIQDMSFQLKHLCVRAQQTLCICTQSLHRERCERWLFQEVPRKQRQRRGSPGEALGVLH